MGDSDDDGYEERRGECNEMDENKAGSGSDSAAILYLKLRIFLDRALLRGRIVHLVL